VALLTVFQVVRFGLFELTDLKGSIRPKPGRSSVRRPAGRTSMRGKLTCCLEVGILRTLVFVMCPLLSRKGCKGTNKEKSHPVKENMGRPSVNCSRLRTNVLPPFVEEGRKR